jgi:hypothetical protein
MQTCTGEGFLGKQIKMTASIKIENVEKWAGLWLRIDGGNSENALAFDNTRDRPIEGTTDCTAYSIILNVPENSATLNFGVLLNGKGEIWLDDVKFQIISNSQK